MTTPVVDADLPRIRGSRRTRLKRAAGAQDSANIGATALRGVATAAAVFGAVSGMMFALVVLFVTALAVLGLLAGVVGVLPAVHALTGK